MLRGAQGLTPTWASFFAFQLLPNFPLTGQTSSPFASTSAETLLFPRPTGVLLQALSLFSHLSPLSALSLSLNLS